MNLANQAAPGGSIGEFHDGVVAFLQELSQFGNGGFLAAGIAGDAEQQLMLLRRDAASPGSLFAEAQEFAQCVTKPSEMAHGIPGRISACEMLIGGAPRCHEKNYIAIRDVSPLVTWNVLNISTRLALKREESLYFRFAA